MGTAIDNSPKYSNIAVDVREGSRIDGDESYGLGEKFRYGVRRKRNRADQDGRLQQHHFFDVHLPAVAHLRTLANIRDVFAPFADADEFAARA
jgi:hypothetical protein